MAIIVLEIIAPGLGHLPRAFASLCVQQAHTITIAMSEYAYDHGGKYPAGNSSTAIFQKLLDGKYVTDPKLFYVPMAGKTEPISGQSLKPENVSWDITSGVDANSSEWTPLVFLTGYRVTYAPGTAAVPIIKPYPVFGKRRTWTEWWNGEPLRPPYVPGIAVGYINNSAVYKVLQGNSNTTTSDFIPSGFDPKGQIFQQLTPDGPLP
ncbi:MAG: hypothetical protein LV481_10535 [Methylacidiphilales bacterium]|nr:hypothetical protein [Candidatus Methylacidiphilales bacterium]